VRAISHSYFISKYRQKKLTDAEDADDLTNDVYLAFAEKYHGIEQLENWLLKVLFLTFIRWYKRNREKGTLQLDENISYSLTVEQNSEGIDAGQAITLLKKLSIEKQNIVQLRIWGGLKFSEIAEELNKSEVSVKKMYYRTLDEIKEKME
jgi:RNA polymerase sigma-70 factor (ECF subfamily)